MNQTIAWASPFFIDKPIAIGLCMAVFAALMICGVRWAPSRPVHWVTRALVHHTSALNDRQITKVNRIAFGLLAAVFGSMAAFSLSVGAGWIDNGPRLNAFNYNAPTNPDAVLAELNSFDADKLAAYEAGDRSPFEQDPNTLSRDSWLFVERWVKSHRLALAEFGVNVRWDGDQRRYVRVEPQTTQTGE